ncbi:hypothetical protein [Nitrospirillum iridis]|uniref:Uncharacterized protein n=1 Tax=Nitrospirillum iridis TaxID=765888 RepID=A0A7X0AWL7_9PROT|nr:hypothetical protein [Nitrospirillum iridis]MBB6251438.1 hypothetical protein [Nitrospirillum iridis]
MMNAASPIPFDGVSLHIPLHGGEVWSVQGRDLLNVAAVHTAHAVFGEAGATSLWGDLGLRILPDEELRHLLGMLNRDVPDDTWDDILGSSSETED